MKWIEIIELRSTGETREQVERHLQNFRDLAEEEAEKRTVKLYTRMMIDNDFSIHLLHDSNNAKISGSSLGIRLVSALKPFGLVDHSIWLENQRG